MAVFLWTDEFHTGLDEVDRQHRRLVDMLNELDEAHTIGSDEQIILDLLDGLAAYTQYHFTTEERLMAEPHFDAKTSARHCAEHRAFVEKVSEVQAAARRDPTVVSSELMEFLMHWLSEHILGTDRHMAGLLRDQGEASPVAETFTGTDALIRALRESESRFRGLADSVPALIWMGDAEGRRSYFNLQWSEYTGLDKEQLMQDGWLQCVHSEDSERIRDLHTNPVDHGAERVAEYRLRRADKRYRWFFETTVPRFHSDGTFAGEVGCAFDITERRQVEQLLRGAKQRLESMVEERTAQLSQANQVLEQRYREQQALTRQLQQTQAQLLQSEKMAGVGQLAAGVAHEINNPIGYVYSNLSSLKGYTDDLLSLLDVYAELETALPPDDSRRTKLDMAKQKLDLVYLRQDMPQLVSESMEGADQARKIVQQLKDFSRIDQQDRAPFDLEAGLESALKMAAKDIGAKTKVTKAYCGLEPVDCIGAELNQVFMQLLTNAAQAMQEQGVINLRTGREGADWVWVEVQDNGRGIPEQDLSRLFDPFFTTKPVGQGTGMGLSLAYNIIRQHGGRIEVNSRLGAGSRFRIWLPVAAEATGASV